MFFESRDYLRHILTEADYLSPGAPDAYDAFAATRRCVAPSFEVWRSSVSRQEIPPTSERRTRPVLAGDGRYAGPTDPQLLRRRSRAGLDALNAGSRSCAADRCHPGHLTRASRTYSRYSVRPVEESMDWRSVDPATVAQPDPLAVAPAWNAGRTLRASDGLRRL